LLFFFKYARTVDEEVKNDDPLTSTFFDYDNFDKDREDNFRNLNSIGLRLSKEITD
jgi:hypothetical protein